MKPCSFFVHQTICGDVVGLKFQRFFNVPFPLFECLVWKAEHKVDAYVVKAVAAQETKSRACLLRCVTSAKETQPLVVKRLYAHAHAVYATTFQRVNQFCIYVVGVCLKCCLYLAVAACRMYVAEHVAYVCKGKL